MAHRLAIKLDVFATTPLYQQLAGELRRLIDDGLLLAGERLPSLRDFSKQLQISVITVRQAVDALLEDGYVVSKPGSGNYVSDTRGAAQRQPESSDPVRFVIGSFRGVCYELDQHTAWSREAAALTDSFNAYPFHPWWDVHVAYDFRAYQPSAEFLRGPRWDKAFAAASKQLLQYPWSYVDPAGLPALREHIAGWLNRSRQLDCSADEVVVVSGAQQARELMARLFVREGRTVIVEEPGSITDSLAYATKGGALRHITQHGDGIDIDALEEVANASLLHVIPAANFPTAIITSFEKRTRIIDWALQTNSLVIEDAYGAGFNYEPTQPPAIFSLASQKKCPVAYIGSLSQFTSPALRIGFIVARKPLAQMVRQAKEMIDHHTSVVSQQMALTLFADGFFDEHYLRLMKACRGRRQTLCDELAKWPADLIEFTPIACGFQQPLWFKQDIDDLYIFEQALKHQVGVIPLSPYFHHDRPRSGLSLNLARNEEPLVRDGLQRLKDVITACAQGAVLSQAAE